MTLLSDTAPESVLEFLDLIWVDVVMLVVSVAVFALSAIYFPKSKLSAQKQGCSVGDGPVVRFHKAIEVALVAFGIIQRPLQRPQKVQSGGLPQTSSRSHESFMIALRKVLSHDEVDEAFGLLKEMQRLDFPIPATAVARMLKNHSPNEACALLRRMQNAGVTPDVVTYNCVLASCGYGGDMQRARAIVKEMRQLAIEPDMVTYTTLLKGFHAAGDLLGAKESLREMAAAGYKPKEITYNSLINAAVASGDFQIAWDTIEMMKTNEVSVSGYTVSIMMKALRQRGSRRPLHSGHAARVFEFLDEFLDESGNNFGSDEILLTTVVDTCVWHQEHIRLEHTIEKYFKSGLKPSVPVYGSLIKASKSLKRIDWVWKLWHELVDEQRLQPNCIVLGCMLDALVCSNLVDEAVSVFQEWKSKVGPTTIMYSTLAKGFLHTNQPAKATQLLHDMRLEGVPRSAVLYNMVIGAHAVRGAMDEVAELMQSMQRDCCPLDIITFSTVVKGHCVKGDLDSAMIVLQDAEQSGIALDAVLYSTIFHGCYRHNRPDLTDELISEMRSRGLTPSSFTLSTIVKLYGSQGRLDRAFEVVEALSQQPNSTDPRVATSLFQESVRKGDLDHAERVFRSLLPMGGAETKFFWPLIACCVQHGEFQRAQGFLKELWCEMRHASRVDLKDKLVEQLLCLLEGKKGPVPSRVPPWRTVTSGDGLPPRGGDRPNTEQQKSEALALIERLRTCEPDVNCKNREELLSAA